MKFKTDKTYGDRELKVDDKCGDALHATIMDGDLFLRVKGATGTAALSPKKAVKFAKAILAEYDEV